MEGAAQGHSASLACTVELHERLANPARWSGARYGKLRRLPCRGRLQTFARQASAPVVHDFEKRATGRRGAQQRQSHVLEGDMTPALCARSGSRLRSGPSGRRAAVVASRSDVLG